MKLKNLIFKHAGVACIPVYIIFTFIAHLYNPKLNPGANWLSDFGNPLLNPGGAIFYNMGCIVTAFLLSIFFMGMYRWRQGRKLARKINILYILAQISGVIANIFLVMASVFPLGTHTGIHSVCSLIHMIGLDTFLVSTATAFFMLPRSKKWLGVFGYLTAAFNIITTNAFSLLYPAEWIYFALFMIYIVFLWAQDDEISPDGPFMTIAG